MFGKVALARHFLHEIECSESLRDVSFEEVGLDSVQEIERVDEEIILLAQVSHRIVWLLKDLDFPQESIGLLFPIEILRPQLLVLIKEIEVEFSIKLVQEFKLLALPGEPSILQNCALSKIIDQVGPRLGPEPFITHIDFSPIKIRVKNHVQVVTPKILKWCCVRFDAHDHAHGVKE